MLTKTLWRPQPGPQHWLINCPAREILYGGARGGGKTDGSLGRSANRERRLKGKFNKIIFRQEMPQADDMIERSAEIFGPLGAKFNKVQSQWTWPSGGRLRFRPLENSKDAQKYQGQNLTDVDIDEAGNYASSDPIDKLWGALRGNDVRMMLTANPGGPGAQWLKQRFQIDRFPKGNKILHVELPNGAKHTRCYIPSKVTNNRALLRADPDYVNRLYLVGSKNLVRAWLDGDWNAIDGAYFDVWDSDKHVIRPFKLPDHWVRYISGDWGSAKPFSFGWWVVVGEDTRHDGRIIPRGALIRYKEWYGCLPDKPNAGLKLTAEQVGRGIRERITEPLTGGMSVIDPAAFAEDGGPSIVERIDKEAKVYFSRADNKRVSQKGALGGWDMMRQRLVGQNPVMDENGKVLAVTQPMIYVFDTCVDSIRTIPMLQHDENKPEDLDTSAEDHAADEWRYACMARPWVRSNVKTPPKKRDRYNFDFDDGGRDWATL